MPLLLLANLKKCGDGKATQGKRNDRETRKRRQKERRDSKQEIHPYLNMEIKILYV